MARKRPTQRDSDPRVPGGRYRSGYWGTEYTVLAIEFDAAGWLVSVTERDDQGTVRTHGTAWDAKRDKVLTPVCDCEADLHHGGAHSESCPLFE